MTELGIKCLSASICHKAVVLLDRACDVASLLFLLIHGMFVWFMRNDGQPRFGTKTGVGRFGC